MQSRRRPSSQSALIFVLKGLIPYTHENMMLAFKPNRFFNELERISRYKRQTLEKALAEAERQKLVARNDDIVHLTRLGQKTLRPFVANRLPSGAKLMVIFDIPEDMASTRTRFRRILQSWQFEQIQKSVWITVYDHEQSVREIAAELNIEKYVDLYECAAI